MVGVLLADRVAAGQETGRLRLGHVPQDAQALHFAPEPDRRAPGEDLDREVVAEEHRVGAPGAGPRHLAYEGEAVAGAEPLDLGPPGGEIPAEGVPGLRLALTDEMVPLQLGIRDH